LFDRRITHGLNLSKKCRFGKSRYVARALVARHTRKREKNGRLQRPSAAERREAQKLREFAEQLTVLAQPHRRGNPDQMCETL
jgi:hypothetical protein